MSEAKAGTLPNVTVTGRLHDRSKLMGVGWCTAVLVYSAHMLVAENIFSNHFHAQLHTEKLSP